jgi:hypothetical protein
VKMVSLWKKFHMPKLKQEGLLRCTTLPLIRE